MNIFKYKQFLESKKYEFGCVLVDYNFTNWSEIKKTIVEGDIYEEEGKNYGLQNRPHLTLLYGLHDTVTDQEIHNCFKGFSEDDFKVEISGVSIFENPDFDVLKLGVVNNSKLQEINSKLSELPNSNQFPEYKPHITIGYLKSGTGYKYVNPKYNYKITSIKKIAYTRPDGTELIINL